MGFSDTMRTGPLVTRRSYALLRRHPKLLVFPVLSALSLVVSFVGCVLVLAAIVVAGGASEAGILEGYWWLGTLAVGYFVAAVLSTYFNAGLVPETTGG